jgi:hypothetical protein
MMKALNPITWDDNPRYQRWEDEHSAIDPIDTLIFGSNLPLSIPAQDSPSSVYHFRDYTEMRVNVLGIMSAKMKRRSAAAVYNSLSLIEEDYNDWDYITWVQNFQKKGVHAK